MIPNRYKSLHLLLQYVENNLCKDLYLFGKSPSEADGPDMSTYVSPGKHVSHQALTNMNSLLGIPLYIYRMII